MKGGEASTDNCPPCPVCQGKLNEQPTEKKGFFSNLFTFGNKANSKLKETQNKVVDGVVSKGIEVQGKAKEALNKIIGKEGSPTQEQQQQQQPPQEQQQQPPQEQQQQPPQEQQQQPPQSGGRKRKYKNKKTSTKKHLKKRTIKKNSYKKRSTKKRVVKRR